MATGSKAKRASAKKQGKKKKIGKRKSKAAITPGIGVISTIFMTREMKSNFAEGVNDNAVVKKYKHLGTYKKPKLKKRIEQFNSDPAIGLIVTVGGTKAYDAAAAYSTKPFISLVGAEPTNPDSFCYGGVTFNSYLLNLDRVNYLNQVKGKTRTKIALFRNPNSFMATKETTNWGTLGAGSVYDGGVDAAGENDSSFYDEAFARIPADYEAVVISADPYFQDTMDELVTAANNSNKYICYPLYEYGAAMPPPAQTFTTLYGSTLLDSYFDLGETAKAVLVSGSKMDPLFTPADVDHKDI